MNVTDALAALDRIDLEHAEVERKRTNPTMAERAERIASLKAGHHGLNELMAARFRRTIRNVLSVFGGTLSWGALHSRVGTHTPSTPQWFRAHEGTYPCVHAGVLIGFCSPEFATAFEALVRAGHLTVEIHSDAVDCYGVPDATVRAPPVPLH